MPSKTKPHKARQAKKRRRIRKLGTLEDMRRKLWQAVTAAEDVLLDDESDNVMVLRAVHAITQASGAYAKLIEVGELEGRLAELEKSLESRAGHTNGRAYA